MQARPERVESNPVLAGEVCGVTGAAQQLLHLARLVFLLDLDQALEFTQVMGVAQGMNDRRRLRPGVVLRWRLDESWPSMRPKRMAVASRYMTGGGYFSSCLKMSCRQ
jgi:hypothetical protein